MCLQNILLWCFSNKIISYIELPIYIFFYFCTKPLLSLIATDKLRHICDGSRLMKGTNTKSGAGGGNRIYKRLQRFWFCRPYGTTRVCHYRARAAVDGTSECVRSQQNFIYKNSKKISSSSAVCQCLYQTNRPQFKPYVYAYELCECRLWTSVSASVKRVCSTYFRVTEDRRNVNTFEALVKCVPLK